MAIKSISELSDGVELAGDEYVPITQGGTTVKVTPTLFADLVRSQALTAELIRDTIGSCLVAGSGISIVVDDSPNTITIALSGGGSGGAFSDLTNGTNTTAAMVVGSGASLSATGSGTIAATSCTGNAATATVLATPRAINGTNFDGSAAITVTAAAGTLTGATLAAGVTGSSLTSVGTLTGLAVAGTVSITSSSATAFTAGRQGATSPALTVDASTASCITGIAIKSLASGSGVSITATGSGTESITYNTAGEATHVFQTNSNNRLIISRTAQTWTPAAKTGTSSATWSWTGATNSTLNASTNVRSILWNMAANQSFNTGAKTLQTDFAILGTSYLAGGASAVTDGATFFVDGGPIASTNITGTNASTIYSEGRAVGSGWTNSYGLNITANTGATNNYAARLAGGAVYLVDITAPSATPATGGFLYSESGALKFKGSSGTVTTVAPA